MRPYEVMIILDAGLEEDAIRGVLDRSVELLRSRGANPGRVDRWGRRRFAYEVNHKSEGYYVRLEVSGEPPALADLDRALHLADEVVRHKVIRLPDAVAGATRPAAASAPAGAPAGSGPASRGAGR